MQEAPFYHDIAQGPDGGVAGWATAADGVRLRLGYWPRGAKGTVLLFPGRTEYIEKYGPAAVDLRKRGYATLTIDFRGQGLSDRLADDPNLGHVEHFLDFQLDVAAMLNMAAEFDCPKPYFLVAHSMGGCIGLRALHDGLPVQAVAFTGPMWGIHMAPALRPVAAPLARVLTACGLGHTYAPTTKGPTYVKAAPYLDNMLTTDADMYAFMQRQADARPELTLSGASVKWLGAALHETQLLQKMTPPDVPVLTQLGDQERIVEVDPIHRIMERWPNGKLDIIPKCEHEIMMENPAIRGAFFDAADELFTANSN